MAAKKAAAERRIREELGRQEHELAQWLDLCDQTETTGAAPASALFVSRAIRRDTLTLIVAAGQSITDRGCQSIRRNEAAGQWNCGRI